MAKATYRVGLTLTGKITTINSNHNATYRCVGCARPLSVKLDQNGIAYGRHINSDCDFTPDQSLAHFLAQLILKAHPLQLPDYRTVLSNPLPNGGRADHTISDIVASPGVILHKYHGRMIVADQNRIGMVLMGDTNVGVFIKTEDIFCDPLQLDESGRLPVFEINLYGASRKLLHMSVAKQLLKLSPRYWLSHPNMVEEIIHRRKSQTTSLAINPRFNPQQG